MPVASAFSVTVTNAPLLLAAAVAALVGIVGFLSPCVLPLVPGYLAYITGLPGTDGRRPGRVIAGALLFVLGFTVIFVSGGIVFGQFGGTLRLHQVAVNRVFGVITIVFGFVFIGRVSVLQREFKIHRLPPIGLLGAPCSGLPSDSAGDRASPRRSARSTSCPRPPAPPVVARS